MRKTLTEERKDMLLEYKTGHEKSLTKLLSFKTALESHKGKLIDARFFALPVFSVVSDEGHTYQTVYMRAKDHEWQKYSHVIYFQGSNARLEIESRETAHILSVTAAAIHATMQALEQNDKDMKALEDFNEDALIRDLQAVYHAHNAPALWSKVLESMPVQYPKDY